MQHSRHLLNPRHCYSIARHIHIYHIVVNLCQRFNHTVLTVRQLQASTVGILAILPSTLVQASDKNHIIGCLCLFYRLSYKLISRTRISKILTGNHSITGIINFSYTCKTGFQSVERRNLTLHLQRRASTTHSHHLYGILTYYKHLFLTVKLQRQYIAIILKQHYGLLPYLLGSSIMLIAMQCTIRLITVHRCQERKAQHITHLVIKLFCTDFTILYHLQIRKSQIICIICAHSARFQSVSPCAEFKVKTVSNSLRGIVRSSPVADYSTFEPPLITQNPIQILVVAGMLTLI